MVDLYSATTLVTLTTTNIDSMLTDPEGTPACIGTISIKLPPFWPANPQLWFAQVEAQFSTQNIMAQKTKFEYVVASLSLEYATEVCNLLLQLPKEVLGLRNVSY